MQRKCTKCNETKDINEFVKDKNKKDGYRHICKKCEKLKRRKTPIKPTPKEGYKYCTQCNKELSLDHFNKRTINGTEAYFSFCKECERKYNNNRYSHTCEICGKKYRSGKKNSEICIECHGKRFSQIGKLTLQKLDQRGEKNPMYGIHRYGDENPNYNPDKTDCEREKQRYQLYGDDVKKWRNEVYHRDNYTCQICGDDKGGNLNAHHLDGYNWCKEKRFDISNGVTLCVKCHKNFHSAYGYNDVKKEQYNEFLNKNKVKECLIP